MTPREAAWESLTIKAIVIGHGIAMWGVLFLSTFLAANATHKVFIAVCGLVTAVYLHRGFLRIWDAAAAYVGELDAIAEGKW